MNKPPILILLPFICYPLNSGGAQGAFHMINHIKEFYDVHIWFHINNEKKERHVIDALDNALGHKCHIHYSSNKIGRNFITARALYRKFCKYFLKNDIQYSHNCTIWGEGINGYCDFDALEDINQIITEYNIQLVQVEFSMLIDMVYALPDSVKKIFIHHELGFARKQTLLNGLNEQYVYDHYSFNKHFHEEIAALNQYDCVVTMSDVDKAKLIESGCKSRIESSPLFIPKPNNKYPSFKNSVNRLTYIASGSHYPNREGLIWFIENIHPRLSSQIDYHLDIIGTGWQTENFPIKTPSNISFKGFVEDLTTIVPGSIMIVPILSGSGMRMKILEAINNSVPFVSTSVGAEGLIFNNGEDCFITDNPNDYTDKILTLLKSPSLQHEFVNKSRENFNKSYSATTLGQKRLDILKSIN